MSNTKVPVRDYSPHSAPRPTGMVGLLSFLVFLAMGLGFVCATYPLAFSSKLAVIILGAVAVVWAFAAAQSERTDAAGNAVRLSINIWAFLTGACPSYLPFKFGPIPGMNPVRVALGAVLVTGLYGIISSRSCRDSIVAVVSKSKLAFYLMLTLLLWQTTCAVIGGQPLFSIYYAAKVYVPAFMMLVFAMVFYRDWQDIHRTAAWLLFGALVTCVIGVIEWRTRVNLFVNFFPTDVQELSGLDWILFDKSRGGDYRVSATFTHPLVLAEFLCMTLPLTLMLAATGTARWHRLLAWFSLPVLLGLIYLSYTRSSLIAAVSSMVVIALIFGIRFGRNRQKAAVAMFGWMTVVAAVWTALALSGSAVYLAKGRSEAETGSSQARVYMLERAQVVLAEQPLQGYGPGMGAIKIGRLPGQRGLTIDSYFLSTAVETGYVGLVLFVLAMAVVLVRTAAAGVRTTGVASWALVALATAIFASLIVKVVLSLTDNLDLMYLIVGMALTGLMLASRDSKPRKPMGP